MTVVSVTPKTPSGVSVSARGVRGPKGPPPELRVFNNYLQWQDDDAVWHDLVAVSDLIGPVGPEGPALQLQKSDTHIQWRVADTGDWTDLVPLVDLEGEQGPTGDMDASVYDTDGDGKVDAADAADTVSWDGVQNKPNFGNLATKNTVGNSDWSGGHLSMENGGTGASTPAAARAAFGIGSMGQVNVTISTSDPSGGANNDFHAKVT